MKKIITVIACLLSGPGVATDKQEQAKAACVEYTDLVSKQWQSRGLDFTMPVSSCNSNTRTLVYWQCVNQRIRKGEAQEFAAENCNQYK